MDPQQHLTPAAAFAHTVADMARSISERSGETIQQQFVRAQVASQLILGLDPGDMIEVMLAGQTVMFHALVADSVRDALRSEIDTMRRGTRSATIGMNRAFHLNLDKLKEYRDRRSEGLNPDEPSTRKPAAEAAPRAPSKAGDKDRTPAAEIGAPSSKADAPAASNPPAPVHLNRAQRRQLSRGRAARQV